MSLRKEVIFWKCHEDFLKKSALILIDSTLIRKNAIKDLKTILKKIEKSKLEINSYLEVAKPEFTKWYNEELTSINSKMEKLEKKFYDLNNAVREVFAYADFHKIPYDQAYFYIQERLKTPPEEREFDPFYDEEEKGYWEDDESNDNGSKNRTNQSKDQDWEDIFEEWRASQKEDVNSSSTSDPKSKHNFEIEKTKIFRSIAKYLHPDKNKEQSPEEKENWLTALHNYTENNLTGLKDILTWIRINKEEVNDEVSISELLSLNAKYKVDLKKIQKDVRTYKKYPDWNFNKLSKVEKKYMKQEIKEDIQSEYTRLYYEIEKIEYLISNWNKNIRQNARYLR